MRLLDVSRGLKDSGAPDDSPVLGGSTEEDGGFLEPESVVGLCSGEGLASSEEESSPRLRR